MQERLCKKNNTHVGILSRNIKSTAYFISTSTMWLISGRYTFQIHACSISFPAQLSATKKIKDTLICIFELHKPRFFFQIVRAHTQSVQLARTHLGHFQLYGIQRIGKIWLRQTSASAGRKNHRLVRQRFAAKRLVARILSSRNRRRYHQPWFPKLELSGHQHDCLDRKQRTRA